MNNHERAMHAMADVYFNKFDHTLADLCQAYYAERLKVLDDKDAIAGIGDVIEETGNASMQGEGYSCAIRAVARIKEILS